ncbi:hypothetical protein IWX65_001755 [Arthrobacter sp. CAN_A214]
MFARVPGAAVPGKATNTDASNKHVYGMVETFAVR